MRLWMVGVLFLAVTAIALAWLARARPERATVAIDAAPAPVPSASAREDALPRGPPVARGPAPVVLAPAPVPPDDVDQRHAALEREYLRWFDAGLGPHQVEVELLPDGTMITRATSGEGFDDEPIVPDALTRWELMRLDLDAAIVVGRLEERARELTGPCLRAFAARVRPKDDWVLEYVWRVRSEGGVASVRVEVREEWWPPLFDEADRACYLAALQEIERTSVTTDARDFDYLVEIRDYLPREDEP